MHQVMQWCVRAGWMVIHIPSGEGRGGRRRGQRVHVYNLRHPHVLNVGFFKLEI